MKTPGSLLRGVACARVVGCSPAILMWGGESRVLDLPQIGGEMLPSVIWDIYRTGASLLRHAARWVEI